MSNGKELAKLLRNCKSLMIQKDGQHVLLSDNQIMAKLEFDVYDEFRMKWSLYKNNQTIPELEDGIFLNNGQFEELHADIRKYVEASTQSNPAEATNYIYDVDGNQCRVFSTASDVHLMDETYFSTLTGLGATSWFYDKSQNNFTGMYDGLTVGMCGAVNDDHFLDDLVSILVYRGEDAAND